MGIFWKIILAQFSWEWKEPREVVIPWRFSSFARSRLQCYCDRKYKELFRSQCPGEHFQLHYRGTKVKGQKHWARVRGAGLQQRARQLLCLATGSTFSLGLRFLLSKNRELTVQGWPGRRGGVFYWSFLQIKLPFGSDMPKPRLES